MYLTNTRIFSYIKRKKNPVSFMNNENYKIKMSSRKVGMLLKCKQKQNLIFYFYLLKKNQIFKVSK